ncbi:MAG: hypothetical protein ABMA64_02140 [Myxococcota bacterium]
MTQLFGLVWLGCADKDPSPPATIASDADTDADTDSDADSDADVDLDSGSVTEETSGTTGDTAVSPIAGRWKGTCLPDGVVFYGATAFDLAFDLTESGGLVHGDGTLLAFSYGSSTTQPPIEVRGTWDGTTLDLPDMAFSYAGGGGSPLGVEITGVLVAGILDADMIWFPGGTYGGPYVYSCPMDPN